MQFESLRSRSLAYLAVPFGVLALTGCGPNYSGHGNDFVVEGRVSDPGSHSLKARITEVDEANGKADGWFEVGEVHQLHDNCNCHGFWASNKTYGEVLDEAGNVISPTDVSMGACVKFIGKIRSHHEGKIDYDRPVYEIAQEESTC